MKRIRTRAALAAGAAAAAAGLAFATASQALAVTFIGRDVPVTATIAPGASGPVSFTYQNTGAGVSIPGGSTRVVFTAPASTTFPPQATIPGQVSTDGVNGISNYMWLGGCTLSNSNTALSCVGYGIGSSSIGWLANAYFRFSPTVTVSPTAPARATLAPGTATMAFTDSTGTAFGAWPPPAARRERLGAGERAGRRAEELFEGFVDKFGQ
jgi:hypothetical protein